jgi:hypothetical protein
MYILTYPNGDAAWFPGIGAVLEHIETAATTAFGAISSGTSPLLGIVMLVLAAIFVSLLTLMLIDLAGFEIKPRISKVRAKKRVKK